MALACINLFFWYTLLVISYSAKVRPTLSNLVQHPRYADPLYRDSFKYVKPVSCCADNCTWNLRVPMDFFYFILSLMDE